MSRKIPNNCKIHLTLLPVPSETGYKCVKFFKGVNLVGSYMLSELLSSVTLTLVQYPEYILSSDNWARIKFPCIMPWLWRE
jgi:hypothetical protein